MCVVTTTDRARARAVASRRIRAARASVPTSRITPTRKDDLTGVVFALVGRSRRARPALESAQIVEMHTAFETTDAFRALLYRQLNSGRGQGDSFHASLDV